MCRARNTAISLNHRGCATFGVGFSRIFCTVFMPLRHDAEIRVRHYAQKRPFYAEGIFFRGNTSVGVLNKGIFRLQKESLGPRKYAQKKSSACKRNLFFGSTNERRVRHPFGSVQAGLGVLVRAHFLGGSFSKQRPVEHSAILLAPSCSHPPTTNNQQQSQWRPRGGPPCPALRASSPTSRAPSRP